MHAHDDETDLDVLRTRLAEAQDVLDAIRTGQVDAILVDGEKGDQVYTLSTAERPYRVMIERMQEGAVTLSSEGGILYCNRYFAELVGQTQEQVIGRSMADFVTDPKAQLQPLLGGLSARGELELISEASADPIPAIMSTTQLTTDGVVNYCAIVADLRTQKYYERLREIDRRLRDADRKKDEFLAMLGHELRNPLAPILHAVEILQVEMKALGSERLEWAIGVIRRQAGQMNRIIDDLLDIGRIARGQVEIYKNRVDLAQVLSAAIEAVRPALEARGHLLQTHMPNEPLFVTGDANRLAQVVTNLLSNAIKYTPAGGDIALELEHQGSQAILRVRDNGVGIAPELLPRIFDLFVQGAQEQESGGGLGLGLNFVHQLVQLHGGKVDAYSAGPGAGSEFTVRLPAVAYNATQPTPGPSAGEPKAQAVGHRVLVVDDNLDAADSLARLLTAYGFEVAVAYDGTECFKTAADFRPQVVCLDLGLPGLDGFEVGKKLRADYGGDLLLIAITGHSRSFDLDRALELGFDHCLVKPVDMGALVQLFPWDTTLPEKSQRPLQRQTTGGAQDSLAR